MTSEALPSKQDQTNYTARFHAASTDAFETVLLDLLYEIEESSKADVYIYEERGPSDVERLRAIGRINILCEALEVKPQRLTDSFISGSMKRYYEVGIEAQETRRAQRHGISIGEFIVDKACWTLPIEWDEEGSGTVKLTLRAGSQHTLCLRAEGYYWTDRFEDDEAGQHAESEIGWIIKYTGEISPSD